MRHIARVRVPQFVWQYIESGSEDEHTLERNRAVFRNFAFQPKTLVDTSERDSSTTLFGDKLPVPIVVAPTGFNGLAYPGGDSALARAAEQTGIPFTLSSFANESIEEVAARAKGSLWFQLYVLENHEITKQLIGRARDSGYKALVLTTDANVLSSREWQSRCYQTPGKLTIRHQIDAVLHARWLYRFSKAAFTRGQPIFANLERFYPRETLAATRAGPVIKAQLTPRITWSDLQKIRQLWDGPLVLKGVLRPDDALRARKLGVDALVLTNHGGRQLDDAISPLEILQQIREVVGTLPLLIDSGFRRGNDVLKAIALGADAVMIGRATLYGLAAAGESGALRTLGILTEEIYRSLGLLGCTNLASLKSFIHSRPTVENGERNNLLRLLNVATHEDC
jgi:(S)-mandelate dehydrogenase